jgi:hypothetical protein
MTMKARKYITERIVRIDASPKMMAETRRQAKDLGLQIASLKKDMITMQRPDAIKPGEGFDVACFWAFSNTAFDQQLAILNRWKNFLVPGGRMIFDMRQSDHDLAGYRVENMIGIRASALRIIYASFLAGTV